MSRAIEDERRRRAGHTSNTATGEKPIEYYKGLPVRVAGKTVMVAPLPDWGLLYVEITPEEMPEIRTILLRAKQRIVKVTDQRIYFQVGE